MNGRFVCIAGAAASLCSTGLAQGDTSLRRIDNGIEVTPISIARVIRTERGIERIGEWVELGAGRSQRAPLEPVFDCFAETGDCDCPGFWFRGTGYCEGLASNDMTLASDTDVGRGMPRADFAWYWSCAGSGSEECVIGVWTQESVPCALDSWDYSGWLLNFGTLECNPGVYYYTNANIDTVGEWPIPTGLDGSYVLAFLTSSGAALATCAQPVLSATGDDCGNPDPAGTQGPLQLDDDNPFDGAHGDEECYDLTIPDCPYELGTAMQFWGLRASNRCGRSDCDGNDLVDSRDFSCFLNLWVAKDPAADCDGSGVVDTRDVSCFLNGWVRCR